MKELSSWDVLAEDPQIVSQQFALFSYLLPDPKKNELERVMIKFRGAYRTQEECKHHAERLSKLDEHRYINIYNIECGKWGSLFTDEELANQEIDIEYSNELMSQMMAGYREQKDKVDKEYSERKDYRKKQLEFDSSKEGQKYLETIEENIISIKDRLEKHKDDLKLNLENIIYVEKRLKYNQDLDIKLKEIRDTNAVIAEGDQLLNENLAEINEEITKLEDRIKLLKEQRGTTERKTIDMRIKDNADLIQYSIDNKVYIQDKINEIKENIKKEQELIKERELRHMKVDQEILNKQSLEFAAKNLTL
jgi:hypothetical protein